MKRQKLLLVTAKAAWTLPCLAVLAYWLQLVYNNAAPEAFILPAILMVGLSFPSGYVATYVIAALYGSLERLFFIQPGIGVPWIFLEWAVLFAVGYMQWFWGLPFLVGAIRRKWPKGHNQPTRPKTR